MNLLFVYYEFILFLMKKLAFILLSFLLFVACSTNSGDSYITTVNEKENEVLLTDLAGLEFALSCRVVAKSKSCGIVFSGFTLEESRISDCSPNTGCTYYKTISGFKDASLLSLQVKDENSGEMKPLISYFQGEVEFMKGDTYVPSVMNLNCAKDSVNAITLEGYYKGDEWIKRDTTIVIKDTIYADAAGKISFSVSDGKKNRASLSIDLSKVLKRIDSAGNWEVGSGMVVVEALDVNFETKNSLDPYLKVSPLPNKLILSGGVNDSPIVIPVVNDAK
jgi:hypothetical protein